MTIKLSLICPVYKVGRYIPELMDSLVVGVNDNSIEIIFVDDCCPENSIDICEQYLRDHASEIRFVSRIIKLENNRGQAMARNAALKVAEGSYIGFIDSDDVISPNYWQALKCYLEEELDIIEFGYEEFSDQLVIPNRNTVLVKQLISSELNPFYTGFFVWTRLYNRELVKDLDFPEGKVYEDIFYNIHAFSQMTKSKRLDVCLVYYRKRVGSTTAIRTSEYSHLLINLTTAITQTIFKYSAKKELVCLLQKKSLNLMLKGLKISPRIEQKKYFTNCFSQFNEIRKIRAIYGTRLQGEVSYYLARIICLVFK